MEGFTNKKINTEDQNLKTVLGTQSLLSGQKLKTVEDTLSKVYDEDTSDSVDPNNAKAGKGLRVSVINSTNHSIISSGISGTFGSHTSTHYSLKLTLNLLHHNTCRYLKIYMCIEKDGSGTLSNIIPYGSFDEVEVDATSNLEKMFVLPPSNIELDSDGSLPSNKIYTPPEITSVTINNDTYAGFHLHESVVLDFDRPPKYIAFFNKGSDITKLRMKQVVYY